MRIFAGIDKLSADSSVIFAIEGGSASGKSTLADALSEVYDCNVFHTDDYFLRPGQRTPERFAEIGGNLDRERLYDEIIRSLLKNEAVCYRPFDCSTFTVTDGYDISPDLLTVVEGCYSMHPALGSYYDLAVWVDIDPQTQRTRIEKRNTPAFATLFFNEWIPLEQAYFAAFDIAARCDIRLEVQL
jgi:uridine kinase